jgi:hypothetical protein
MEIMSNIVEENTFKEPEVKAEVTMPTAEETAAAANPPPPAFDPVASASQVFQKYFPLYCGEVDKLSQKQMKRVAKAVIGLPLEEKVKPNLKDEKELNAFYLAERLLQAKMVIIHHAMVEQQRKSQEKAEAAKKETEVQK